MQKPEQQLTFKSLFLPFTTKKAIVIIFIVGFVVYFNSLFNGFVWDDLTYILNNPEIKNFNLLTLIGPNMFNSSGYFRPIPAIYFSALYNLFGNSAFFYHFSQILLHIGSTILLYFIFKKFFNKPISLILSLIFLVHPINVESVIYVGASQSQLYFIFGGLALYLALGKLTARKILLMHLFLLLAILVKEISILYFLVIYLYLFLKNKRVSKLIIFSSFLTLSIYTAIRFYSLGTILEKMERIPISQVPFVLRLAHIPIIFFYYLKTFFFPKLLVINQVWTIKNLDLASFYFPLTMDLLFFACIFGVFYYLVKKKSKQVALFAFFLIWFLTGMAFLLQIFPLDMTVADRWFYFPMVGLLGMFGIIASHISFKFYKKYKTLGIICVIILLVVLSVRTIIRNSDWFSPLTLYSTDSKPYLNYDLESKLASEYIYINRFDLAFPHLFKSVELFPHDTNLFNLGSVYDHLGDYKKAQYYYEQVLNLRSDTIRARIKNSTYEGLIKILIFHGDPKTTNKLARTGVQEFPQDGTLWMLLAINEYTLNHYNEALFAVNKAKTLFPNDLTNNLYRTILNKQPLKLQP
jgi:tetratricopeptide (TPR) repeat protein